MVARVENNTVSQMWVDLDRPTKVEDMVLDEKLKASLANMINSKNITNITLVGKPGIGKTTLARIIGNTISDPDNTLFVPCGIEGTIATVRTKITEFCQTIATPGVMKIVILDEFDSMSGGGVKDTGGTNSAQKALRSLVELFQGECRFIMTCNSSSGIINPIASRCPIYNLTFSKKDVGTYIKKLLSRHEVKYTDEVLASFWKMCGAKLFPDIRGIVNNLQAWCTTGELVETQDCLDQNGQSPVVVVAKEVVDRLKKNESITSVRRFIYEKSSVFGGNYQELVSAICNDERVSANPKAIVAASTYAFRMSQVSDPELQMFAFLYSLKAV